MTWVWESSRAEGMDRLVLLAIADNANDQGANAWPSVATIAGKAKVSERTVQRCVKSLQLLGELEVVIGGGRHNVNIYTVLMNGRQDVTPSESHPVNVTPIVDRERVTTSQERVSGSPETVTPVSPEPSLTIKEPSKTLSSARADVERICGHLADAVQANGSKRPRVTDRWRSSARLLLDADGKTEDQIHNAIAWCQGDEFWRANILSLPKLREKYDQMRLTAQRGKASTTNKRVTDAEPVIAKYEAMEAGHAQV